MPIHKCDFIFNEGRQGWVESWYLDSTSIRTAYNAFFDKKTPPRMKLLGEGCFLDGIRVSNTEVWGDSFVKTFAPGVFPGKVPTPADIPGAAVLVRVEATSLYRRQMWLRGLPDAWIGTDAVTGHPGIIMRGDLEPALDRFLEAAKEDPPFQIPVIRKGPGFERIPVISASALPANGGLEVICEKPHGIPNNSQVRISRIQHVGESINTARPVNGIHYVTAIPDPNSLTFGDLLTTGFGYIRGGSVHLHTKAWSQVTDMIPVRTATRRTGRALFVPAGRRRARA